MQSAKYSEQTHSIKNRNIFTWFYHLPCEFKIFQIGFRCPIFGFIQFSYGRFVCAWKERKCKHNKIKRKNVSFSSTAYFYRMCGLFLHSKHFSLSVLFFFVFHRFSSFDIYFSVKRNIKGNGTQYTYKMLKGLTIIFFLGYFASLKMFVLTFNCKTDLFFYSSFLFFRLSSPPSFSVTSWVLLLCPNGKRYLRIRDVMNQMIYNRNKNVEPTSQ